MARTTPTLVRQLLSTGSDYDVDRRPSVDPFITRAGLMVDRVVACAARKGLAMSSDELANMETWLAAFFYALADPIYQSKSLGGASGAFQGQAGMGLEQNRYGQGALLGDWTGCLNLVSKNQRAGGFWGGKTATEATSYEDRN